MSSSLNSRFKGLGFGKRKSTASIPPTEPSSIATATPPASATPPPAPPPAGQGPPQIPQQFPRPGPAPSIASSSSQQSLQTMNHPGAGPRPPSYTANYNPGGPPPPLGRMSPQTAQGPTRTPPSQMVGGPPPINTGAPVQGYPPQMQMPGAPPPHQGGPPGYAGATGYPPPAPPQNPGNAMQQFGRPAAEVEGNSRSKAQLIVGIDFVRSCCNLAASPLPVLCRPAG